MTSLREEIDALPLVTRRAMLRVVQSDQPLAAGAYSYNLGVCPLLAAHRRGGRSSPLEFVDSEEEDSLTSMFPQALDEFAGVDCHTARLLTESERAELDNLLTQSLAREYEPVLEAVA